MRIAAIADIHSNSLALEAVLADIEKHQVDSIIHLGDAFNGPIDPKGVASILRSVPMVHVRGNGERMVLSDDPAERKGSANYARQRLDESTLNWIRSWPLTVTTAEYFAFHGTPTSDVDYLVEVVFPGGVTIRPPDQLAAVLGNVTTPLILCGHTHVPQFVRVDAQRAVVNPGSVGLQAYMDTQPIRHSMQTGSPEARYAVIDLAGSTLTVTHRIVPYDYRRAAELAAQAGFTAWIPALVSGFAEL